ncbi:MAG: amidohydrolase family protein [Cyclobacteriaceae bacterium]|nr:amidohydrolase family protein [Cyclobacteriaceae bacterium]
MKLQGYSYQNNLPIEINLIDQRIESIIPISHPANDFSIGPGFTDIQVNGYGGVDYNEVYTDPNKLSSIPRLLFKAGVTTHFPTIITNSAEQISKLIKQVVALRKSDELARLSIEGLHIEGPFISPADGPRGAHPKEFVCPPDWSLVQRWQDDAEGLISIITLSPEWESANSFIEQCVKNKILVSIGHTQATHQQLHDAVSAGARLSTHLGNGMHPIIPRFPNYLWSQLADDRLGASIISDGFHLPVEVIQVFKKVKNEKMILVSDSVSLAGMPPGDYDLHIGGQVTLTKEGKLHLRNNPSIFAGSSANIKECVSFLVKNNLASLSEAWEMASVRPQRLLHPDIPVFEKGALADLVILKKNQQDQIEVIKTIKEGREVYSC